MDLLLPIIILALLTYLILQNFDAINGNSLQSKTVVEFNFPLTKNKPTDEQPVDMYLDGTSHLQGVKKKPVSTLLISVNSSDLIFETSHFVYRQLFRNITKTKDKRGLYDEMPEDEHLIPNKSFFVKNFTAKDTYNFKTLISGDTICLGRTPFVLIMIPSQIENRDLRETIRSTWLKAAEDNVWPRFNVTVPIKHFFLFGYRPEREIFDTNVLQKESDEHGDIVVVDLIDTYENLSLKVVNGIEWTLRHCSGVTFFLKVDEDTLINAPLMVELLTHVNSRRGGDAFVLGIMHGNPKPDVSRTGRWKVSTEVYPLPYYPRYLYGHAYAISSAALRVISVTAKRVNWIMPEDALITGVLAVIAGIQRLDAPSFTVCCRLTYDCEVVWNNHVALTSAWNSQRLNRLWTGIVLNQCSLKVPF